MMLQTFLLIALASVAVFFFGKRLAQSRLAATSGAPGHRLADRAHSLPGYHGFFAAWVVGLGGFVVAGMALAFPKLIGGGVLPALVVAVTAGGFALSYRLIGASFRARIQVERFVKGALLLCSGVAVLTVRHQIT